MRSQWVLICSGANLPELRRRISNPYHSRATGRGSIYRGFHFRELSCRPSLFSLNAQAGIRASHPPLPSTSLSRQRWWRAINTRAIKSHNILQKLGSIQSPAVLSLKGCSPGGKGGGGAQWSGLLGNKTKQPRTCSCISHWQKRYGGRLAEKPSISKRNHHFSIITPEESN